MADPSEPGVAGPAIDAAGGASPAEPRPVASTVFRLQALPDGTNRFLAVGDRLWDLAGLHPAECLADIGVFWQRVHPDDRSAVKAAYESATTTLRPWFAEFRIEGPDGRMRWLRVAARPVRDPSGSVVHQGVVIDVSEGKWVEDALMNRPEEPSEGTGDAFFRGLVEHLGRALKADAAIGLAVEGPEARDVRRVASWTAVRAVDPIACDVDAGPIRDLLRGGIRTVPSDLRGRYPRDAFAAALQADAFAGLPLTDGRGRVIGVLAAWFRTHLPGPAAAESVLTVFAQRAAAELERRRADEDLRRSEALLRGIVDNTTALVFVKDLEGRYLLVNRQWCATFDRSPDEVLAHTDIDLFPSTLADQYRANDRVTLESGRETVQEEDTVQRDGTHTYIAVKFPLRDGQGRPFATGGIATDITERKRTERALVEERTFASTVLELTGSLVVAIDANGRVVRSNQAMETTLGWGPSEAAGRPIEDILVPASGEDWIPRAFAWLIGGGEPLRHEGDWLGRDGSIHRIVWTGSAIRDEDGGVRFVIGTGQDVTERHRLEVQLAQAHRMESLGRLAGGIAHDFNNLLTPILGYSDLLLAEMPAGDRRTERLHQVHEAAQRAHQLTRQLLAFGRGQVMERRQVHLGEVIDAFGRILRRTIREDIRIQTIVAPDLGRVLADPTQVEQVILNLALNAQDAMPEGGTLALEASNADIDATWAARCDGLQAGPHVLLTVSDDGTGMDEETLRHIFEPFFTTKETGKGTGLGLATVYGIVRQLDGAVEVHSTPGKGTTFRILLPRADAVARHEAPSEVASARATGHETLLVVEDNDMVRGLAVDVLREHGYTVLDAAGPAEALALLADSSRVIDLLLTDLVMPGLDGRELYRRAAMLRPGLRVVYMSGYAEHVVERYGLVEADTPFLHKPFSVAALTRRIREVLDGAAATVPI